MTMTTLHMPSRRHFLLGSGTLFTWAHLPKLARAEGRDPRFLTIVLRGALDGLATVAPVGDPDWVALRGDDAFTLGSKTPALKLDDYFALNPAMPKLQRMFAANEALIVHAAATSYRERSHFDGQDVLETGVEKPGTVRTGWLNRLLGRLAPEDHVATNAGSAFAVGPVTPLVARGPAPMLIWSPRRSMTPASADTINRLVELYRHHNEGRFAEFLEGRTELAALAAKSGIVEKPAGPLAGPFVPPLAYAAQQRTYFSAVVGAAAQYLAQADGPRVGALSLEGWDTHSAEGIASGTLAVLLGALDDALAAIKDNMGAAWRETVVVLITEFGRTARINGSKGTDHGTATVALAVGGALKGGRVIADWPGLKPANLLEDRDLKPTIDLRAVLKGLLRDHLRADDAILATDVFPGSEQIKPMAGLVASG
jgi:uncharacterized protein (DUF1501 family)